MKHLILFTFLALLTSHGMAKSIKSSKHEVSNMGEVETDCPWAKQDERSGDNSAKDRAIAEQSSRKKKVRKL